MKVYEEQSGLFDPEGNIAAGREIYYPKSVVRSN